MVFGCLYRQGRGYWEGSGRFFWGLGHLRSKICQTFTSVWVQFLIVVEYDVRLWVSVEVASWRAEIGAGAVAVYLPSAAVLGPARFGKVG